MKTKTITLAHELDSKRMASLLTKYLMAPLILGFSGEIGTGKTTFIRAILHAIGIKGAVKSPSFSLVESYVCPNWQLHHFDLYRIHSQMELEYIGFRDYFSDNTICCIEWPENAIDYLENIDLHFKFEVRGSGRELTMSALTASGESLLACFLDGLEESS